MTPQLKEEIQLLLRKHGLSPVKYRGQNFLISQSDLEAIADATDPAPRETLVEVGAGVGNLTEVLAQTKKPVIAIEKDKDLVHLLKKRFASKSNIRVVENDVLKLEEGELPSAYILVGNIPYYLTGALLRKFLTEIQEPPRRVVLTIQKEVAERIVATPPHATFLSNMVSLFGEAKTIHVIPPSHFWPPPKVSSAVIVIETKKLSSKQKEDALNLLAFIRAGFRQPRKTLLNNLVSAGYKKEAITRLLKETKLTTVVRPHDLSLGQWGLFEALRKTTGSQG